MVEIFAYCFSEVPLPAASKSEKELRDRRGPRRDGLLLRSLRSEIAQSFRSEPADADGRATKTQHVVETAAGIGVFRNEEQCNDRGGGNLEKGATQMAEILLIDDMAVVRRAVTKHAPAGSGHSVTVSENGTQGLEMLKSRRFHLVVTDMLMPGADGADVLGYVGGLPNRMPVIAISGGGAGLSAGSALALARIKADAFLEKPFTREELTEAVDKLLKWPGNPCPVLGDMQKPPVHSQ